MRELFIYYRVDSVNSAALRAGATAMQARLCAKHPGLLARLLRRPEVQDDGAQTWMETYAADLRLSHEGVGPAWQAAIDAEAAVLEPLLLGPRHTEVFISAVP